MRKPSIHITIDKFSEICEELGIKISDSQLREFFMLSRSHSLDHRSLISVRQSKESYVNKRVSSSIGDANLLADTIYAVRIKLRHIGVVKIKQSDPSWVGIKELVNIVNTFCETFNLKAREGYIEFVTIGFKLMESLKKNLNYCITWFTKNSQLIFDYQEATQLIKNDKYPEETQDILDIYNEKVIRMTGIYNDSYAKNPLEYVNFVKAKQLANSLNISYSIFIEAQFDALSFCNGIPNIKDLWGDKAKERLVKYMSSHNISIRSISKPQFSESVWRKFKE